MTATKAEIGARVDALARAHDGEAFVAAVEELAAEVGPEGRPALEEVLMERAGAEEKLARATAAGYAEKGWWRRTLGRLDRLQRDEQADRVAAALQAGADGEPALAAELEALRGDRGRAAVVLDSLSRHADPGVRAWVPPAAVDLLGDGAERLVRSMTRDRDAGVSDAAAHALAGLEGGSS